MSYMGHSPRGGNLFTKDTLYLLLFVLGLTGIILGVLGSFYWLASLP